MTATGQLLLALDKAVERLLLALRFRSLRFLAMTVLLRP